MTRRQELESQAIKDQLEPSDKAGDSSCIAPEDLAHKFGDFLRDNRDVIRFGIYDDVMAADSLKFSEILIQVPEEDARILVTDFADHLATQSEENIADYWGGSLSV